MTPHNLPVAQAHPVPKAIVIVAYPDVQLLDVAGPLEVFAIADRLRPGTYRVEVVTSDGAAARDLERAAHLAPRVARRPDRPTRHRHRRRR